MKKVISYVFYIAAVIAAAGCAKEVTYGPNAAKKRFLNAWISVHHPDAKSTWNGVETADSSGIYILSETEGQGEKTVTDNGYAIVEYTVTDLNGNISQYTSSETALKLGKHNDTYYYGPKVWLTKDATIPAGVQDAIVGMKTGGSKKVVVPSWLMTYATYSTSTEYLNQSSDYSDAIYEFTVKDFTDSIDVWQIDSIKRYIEKNYGSLEAFSNDTTGFYYRQIEAPSTDEAFGKDTTIYINYTGKLLNGLVFDTTIERVAKENNLYTSSKKYEPVSIKWGSKHSEITMGSSNSSLVPGFTLTLWQMKAMEKGVGIFNSPLGYGYSGSGESIPAYAPLMFEIEIVEKP